MSDDTSLDLTEILAVDDEVTRSTGSDGFGVTDGRASCPSRSPGCWPRRSRWPAS